MDQLKTLLATNVYLTGNDKHRITSLLRNKNLDESLVTSVCDAFNAIGSTNDMST